jgi:hypothetical protein
LDFFFESVGHFPSRAGRNHVWKGFSPGNGAINHCKSSTRASLARRNLVSFVEITKERLIIEKVGQLSFGHQSDQTRYMTMMTSQPAARHDNCQPACGLAPGCPQTATMPSATRHPDLQQRQQARCTGSSQPGACRLVTCTHRRTPGVRADAGSQFKGESNHLRRGELLL